MTSWTLHQGENLTALTSLPRGSVDAIVTDPPYGLSDHKPGDVALALEVWLQGEEYLHHKAGFLGKDWDAFVPSPPLVACLLRGPAPWGLPGGLRRYPYG